MVDTNQITVISFDTINDAIQEYNECKNCLQKEGLVIIKNCYSRKYINDIKDYLSIVGKSSLPTYEPVVYGAPNFHRVVRKDKRSYVLGSFHQFSFFPWNQDPLNLFKEFSSIYELKHSLSHGKSTEFDWEITDKSLVLPRLSFQHYPKGEGFLSRHADPAGDYQDFVATLCMSRPGDGYDTGGLYFKNKSGICFPESIADIGDVFIFKADIPHGVEPINDQENVNWLNFDGRWMMIFATNLNQDINNKIHSVQT